MTFQEFIESLKKKRKPWENKYGLTYRQAPPPAPVGRNAQCPCGSGKKYKKCCGNPLKEAR